MCPSADCKHPTYYRQFIETLNDNNLQQIVKAPTRNKYILDLFLTNNDTYINRSSVIPGLSDHDIVQIDANVQATLKKNRSPGRSPCTTEPTGRGSSQ